MAASGESGASGGGGSTEEAFMTFYIEVKQIEKRDSVLTSKNQIERLTRPGSSYFNLNPFEYSQSLRHNSSEKSSKNLNILCASLEPYCYPFWCILTKIKMMLTEHKRLLKMKERKKQLKKEGKPTNVEEDDPELFKQAVYKQTMKLFAELEIKRKEREAKEMHERKRQREEKIEAQEKAKREREWQKNFEESRDGRVDSWRNFQANTKGKKEKKNRTFLRPPKVKMEQRE
ncbi:dnaJ homolog subfamily C member 8 isoform X3 [Pipistrellus kuhlii]|nr:dnaJ homolog subfamily C member 8 isoform X3 [Pipistrellus kuhlii]